MFTFPRRLRREYVPAEHRSVTVIGDRVTEIQTRHVGEATWLAVGRISEPMPTGPHLSSPIEVTATGRTERLALDELKRRIEEISRTC